MSDDTTKLTERKAQSEWEPNFTQVPNVLLDRFMPVLSPAAFKVLMFVCRKTYGFKDEETHQRKVWDALAIPQIENGTGLSYTCISEALADLKNAGILCRGKLTRDGYLYSINKTCDVAAALEILRPKPRAAYPPRQKRPPTKLAPPTKLDPNSVGPQTPTKLDSRPQLSWDTKENLKRKNKRGKQSPPLSPNVALIAQKRLIEKIGDSWRSAQSRMTGDNKRQALFAFVRTAGKSEGLEHAQTRDYLSDHPGWSDWPDLKDLDAQGEISFPPEPVKQPESTSRSIFREYAAGFVTEYHAAKQRGDRKAVELVREQIGRAIGRMDANAIDEFIQGQVSA